MVTFGHILNPALSHRLLQPVMFLCLMQSSALASFNPPPENDQCIDARPIDVGSVEFSNVQANTDGPEFSSCVTLGSSVIHNDVWFEFTALETGTLSVSTCDQADFDTRIAVYVGTCELLTEVGCNDDGAGCGGYSSRLLAPCVKDERYLIRIGSFHPSQSGQATVTVAIQSPCFLGCQEDTRLELEPCGGFTNDGCDSALLGGVEQERLAEVSHVIESITLNDAICGRWHFDGVIRDTDWYRLVVPEPGANLTVMLDSSEFIEANLYLASESCPLEIVEYATGGCETMIDLEWVTAGAYQIIVAPGFEMNIDCDDLHGMDRYSLAVIGDVSTENAPVNDLCLDALTIDDGLHPFSTFYASTDGPADSPVECGDFGTAMGADIWFEYISPVDGDVTASLCGLADFDTRLEVRSESCSGPMITCNDDSEGCADFTSKVTFSAECGERFSIRVGGYGYGLARGDGVLELSSTGGCCVGDLDGDGFVTGTDLATVLAVWGSDDAIADFDGDGVVGGADLAVILAAWGGC